MENRKKFIPYLIASLIIHIAFFLFLFLHKEKPLFVSSAIDVTFYSPSYEKSEIQSFVQEIPDIEPEVKPEEIKQEEVKAQETEVLEKPQITKEDVIVKPEIKPEEKEKTETAKETNKENQASLNKVSTVKKAKEKRYTVAGSQYAGVAFDTEKFQYGFYTDTIVRRIGSNWAWSESYTKLKAVVFFRILRNGTVTEIAIKNSSGNKRFDNNALNAVRRAGRFAPLPESYKSDSLGVYFEFKYRT
ncbi:MAG: TonB family protein [Endomicrobium sp.]|jgi:protein TonB|nr:TonB family protein [Endomicrobium sp.]